MVEVIKLVDSKYSREDLYKIGPQKVYKDKHLNEICFPIGGIGTGSIGLTGIGRLRDWEIFNRPYYGSWFPKTFAAIRFQEQGAPPICRILEGPIRPPYTPRDGGHYHANGEGLPHMDDVEFRGEYPFAWITFKCDKMPLKIELEAFNPFIPSDPDASSYPIAVLNYKITNTSNKPVTVSIMWSLLNPIGNTLEDDKDRMDRMHDSGFGMNKNLVIQDKSLKGVLFSSEKYQNSDPKFGSLCLCTPNTDVSVKPYWKKIGWFNAQYDLWNEFKQKGEIAPESNNNEKTPNGTTEAGVVCIKETIAPSLRKDFKFYISWYFPNCERYWKIIVLSQKPAVWKNYYATIFKDALDVAIKFDENYSELYSKTKQFHDSLFSSTIPNYILEAISCTMSNLKTATCLRYTDGTLYGWEGTNVITGCCEGTCTHVWNYQQCLPFLFPSLERSLRDCDYQYNFLGEEGALNFRIKIPFGGEESSFGIPCADGQLGGIIKLYRDWKICGNDDWLKSLWPRAKKALEFAWIEWDEDMDGVLEGSQHNTYDVNFLGPNTMLTTFYLGALKAGSEIASYLGDNESSKKYLELFERGRKWVDDNLFNGEYYIQKYDPKLAPRDQYGDGCLADQLIGLWLSRVSGIERFLDEKKVKSALSSIVKYNYKESVAEHENIARLYAVNDEACTLICTWPKGNRPENPVPYADECFTGTEYAFASLCMIENMLDEGLKAAKAVRDRHDGFKRNPWDEFECGHHYARSMASYGLLIALSGFEYHKNQGYLGFDPKVNRENFKCFWALDGVWGNFCQNKSEIKLEILYGSIQIQKLHIPYISTWKNIECKIGSKPIQFSLEQDSIINFPDKLKIARSEIFSVSKK